MKRFVIKVLLFLLIIVLVVSVPSYLIDPYNVFHWDNIRNNGIEPNKNYIKTKYVINNPDKYDGFVFGSSRVGSIHVEKMPGKTYNMTYSMGTPAEHLETIKTFLDNRIEIKTIYIGVDMTSYIENPEQHYRQPIRCPYQQLDLEGIVGLYLTNPVMIMESIPVILRGERLKEIDTFYEYGWSRDYDTVKMDITAEADSMDNSGAATNNPVLMKNALEDIRRIKQLCDSSGIELKIFTNPIYKDLYIEAVKNMQYTEFLTELAEVTDYHNFSGLNDVTVNENNYIDISHYDAYVGDMIIDTICNGRTDDDVYEQGFGWYVTKDNVGQLIELLTEQMNDGS